MKPNRKNLLSSFAGVGLLACLVGSPAAEETTSAAIDRDVWSVIRQTVVDSDIGKMASAYHPDAVLVFPSFTVSAGDQLAEWGRDMVEMEKLGTTATVDFRFTRRQDDEFTAFESGMFKYATADASGAEASYHVPFEALLVKKEGRWLILMERQLERADEAAWAALE